ncbi:MAG: Sec-independent protein translocase subunit TatA/TatB [Acidimicrobiia bacterium]
MNLGATEIIIIAVVVLLLFGGAAIPKFARNIGKAQSEFKKGLDEGEAEGGKSSESGRSTTDS